MRRGVESGALAGCLQNAGERGGGGAFAVGSGDQDGGEFAFGITAERRRGCACGRVPICGAARPARGASFVAECVQALDGVDRRLLTACSHSSGSSPKGVSRAWRKGSCESAEVGWFYAARQAILRVSRGTRPSANQGETSMHELFAALSLSILTFMPCIVTMDDEAIASWTWTLKRPRKTPPRGVSQYCQF